MSGMGVPQSQPAIQHNLQTPNSVARPQGVLRSRFRGNFGGFEPARPICATASLIRVARPASPPLGQFLLHFRKRRVMRITFSVAYISLGRQSNRSVIACTNTTMISRIILNSARAIVLASGRFAFRLDGLARLRPFGDAPCAARGLPSCLSPNLKLCRTATNVASVE